MINIVIYGQENCGWCEKAKQLLDSVSVGYTYYDIHNDGVDIETLVTKTAPGAKTVPIVVTNDTWIGGYTELKAHVEKWQNIVANLRKLLREGKDVFVKFVKSDGSEREMVCTTNPDHIPTSSLPKTAGTPISKKKIDPNLFTVFDIEKGEWRSFKADRLLKAV